MTDLATLTLDELKPHIVAEMLPDVPFDGWTHRAAANAATRLGLDPALVHLAFPKAIDMIDCWTLLIDEKMAAACDNDGFRAMKIREKISQAINRRLEESDPEVARRALAVLAFPVNAARTARISWRTADAIWRAAGDTSTDFAYYSKRMTVAAIYSATILYYLEDDSDDHANTRAFLDRRIADVMRFEAGKAKWRGAGGGNRLSLSRFLGRLRYPVEPI